MTLDITAWKIQRRDKPQRGYSGLMDLPTLLSFSLFAFVAAFTPGPNNVMLAASGANFGFRASLPHILGVFAGFMILVVAAGFGLASLFAALPALYDILKIISILFLLYLAWKIANAGRAETRHDDRPLRFWQACHVSTGQPEGDYRHHFVGYGLYQQRCQSCQRSAGNLYGLGAGDDWFDLYLDAYLAF
jgi:hypothetical protein